MVQRAITQTRWRRPSCFREYVWDGAVAEILLKLTLNTQQSICWSWIKTKRIGNSSTILRNIKQQRCFLLILWGLFKYAFDRHWTTKIFSANIFKIPVHINVGIIPHLYTIEVSCVIMLYICVWLFILKLPDRVLTC